MQKSSRIAIVVLVLGILVFIPFQMLYHEHDKTEDLKPDFEGSTLELADLILHTSGSYSNRIVEISGQLTYSDASVITLDHRFICLMDSNSVLSKKMKNVTIKGRYVGYDDLLDEFKLDNCLIITSN